MTRLAGGRGWAFTRCETQAFTRAMQVWQCQCTKPSCPPSRCRFARVEGGGLIQHGIDASPAKQPRPPPSHFTCQTPILGSVTLTNPVPPCPRHRTTCSPPTAARSRSGAPPWSPSIYGQSLLGRTPTPLRYEYLTVDFSKKSVPN